MSGYNDYQHWPQESTSNTDEDELSSPEIEQDDSDDDSETSTSSTSTSASSSSGSSQSGSDSESTSTADEDETISLKTEIAVANKTELSLPAGMCEDEGVFKQLFSVNSWVCLSDQQKQHLKNFLPTFPGNDLMEKEITLRMLFGGQSFRFGVNPIDDFHDKLKNGHYRPDIVRMKAMLRRSLKKEYRKSQRIYCYNTLKKLLSGRKKIIDILNGVSPTSMINIGRSNSYTMHQQVRRRYFRELSDIKHLVGDDSDNSSDSNYQEGPPAKLSKKQRRNLAVLQNSLSPEVETITSTLANFPEGIDLSKIALPMSNPFDPTEDMYREMLISHKKKQKKIEQEKEQMRFDLMKEQIKPTVSGNEKKRSAANDRPRVKRTKITKQQTQSTQPPLKLDLQLPMQLDTFDNIPVKQEPVESEPISIPFVKTEPTSIPSINKEVYRKASSPPPSILPPPPPPPPPISPILPSPPPTVPTHDLIQEESIKTNLDAIKLEPQSIIPDIVKIEEEKERQIKIEPISLTADEIRKAEEGQAAAAMLLEQMSDVEEKYNNSPLILSSPPSSPPPSKNNLESKYSSPTYHIKREFHPEDMLTCTVQSISTESPPKMLHSCMRPVTPTNYGSKQLSLSPVSTPSKVITDTNYVGSLSELEGFHVLDIKTESHDDLGIKLLPEARNITASFFALIRDIICSTWEYRMNMTTLIERVQEWVKSTSNQKKPDWYQCLALKTWPKALQSAIGFLAGHFPEWQPEDFVPFIEYKPSLNTYQWIGAGRDSDTRLGELCNCWLQNLNNISSKLKNITEEIIGIKNVSIPSSTADIMSTIKMPETDSLISLPTPLLDTWIVTLSNSEERAAFQAQEKQRFLKPHRSFIYQMHGYESVVGPVRGIYNSSNIHKAARGHSLLIENRPHFISILVLVRDATARLPNGMGTRSDICILLRDSQYLMEANQTELHNAVSGALDRLHYEHDPCVKYDAKRKIWIYLHRGRTLEEFERLHLEQQGAVKIKCWRRNKTLKKSPEPKRIPNSKVTSNVLSESLSMLDFPTSSTSDSMPSSSTSPVLSDVNMRVTQDIMNTESLKLSLKTPVIIKNRKIPMQKTDNEVELNIECPSLIDQNSAEVSQMFVMPVSNNISTSATSNSSTITACNITSKTFTSNITNPFTGNITSQSFTNNIISPSIASSNIQSIASSNIQSIASSNIQSIASSNIQSIASSNIQSIASNNSKSIASSNIHSISGSITSRPMSSNITTSHSMSNTNLKVVNTQSIANTGQMIKISQSMNNSNQNLINNNKIVVNSISSNKQVLSSGELITIGSRKKPTKHVQIAQQVAIGSSSVPTNFQQDHHITITKSPQNKELQRQIFVVKHQRSDNTVSNSEPNATIISQTEPVKQQTVQQFLQLQQQQKLHKQQQMQLKLMQQKQIQQQNKPQVIIRKSDADDKTEASDGEPSQVKYIIQGTRGVQSEPQQITPQHFQPLLMIRPQQQTGQQAQVVMVKQSGSDQKPISLKPILTSIRGAKIHQNPTKTTNMLLQTQQAGPSVQHRITKPIVGKIVPNPQIRAQLPADSAIGNRKLSSVPQGASLRISGVQTSKSGQPHYTVVTMAQPKHIPSNQLNIGQQTPTRLSSINERLKSGDSNQPQTLRVVQSQISGKPVLVTNKTQISSSLTCLPTSSSVVSAAGVNSTANTYTVVQQGSQQILVPASSLKSIQGLKVIPLSQHHIKGRSHMYTRIVNPDGTRPMFIQQQSNQDTSQGSSESNT